MAKVFTSYREESKENYGQDMDKNECLCLDQLKVGALLRIADASEKMAKNFTDLQKELDRYKRYNENRRKECIRLKNRIAGLKGTITRMKRNIIVKR